MSTIGILGAGTWGMALARMLANTGHQVMVWSAIASEIEELSNTKKHKKLPEMGKRRTDKFVVFVYTLVALMFFAQIAIIVAFELI